jgi:hypothetical protein
MASMKDDELRRLIRMEAESAESEEALNADAPLPEGTKITRGHSHSATLLVRLNVDELASLERLADERELPVSTLARSFLIDGLRNA